MERKVLGKGLAALISPEETKKETKVALLNPEEITTNQYQPRERFNEDTLRELVDSVREKGLIQPIIVRESRAGSYELIAGERRLRAIKALGYKEIPAIIKNVSDQEVLELSIIENIQRDDLNPLEEAKAYESLMKGFGFTQEQVAKSVGKNRTTIANTLRLLSLPEEVKEALSCDLITLGHAKAILSIPDSFGQLALLNKIVKQGLSVRAAEVQPAPRAKQKTGRPKSIRNQQLVQLEEELQHLLGTKVKVIHGKKRGKIQIEYYSLDDLERVLAIIRRH